MNAINETTEINGRKQSLMTLCTDPGNPVLLIVHGGAGCPDRPLVLKHNSELAVRYTVVCWDQRGSGFSFTGGPLTVGLLLSDLKAVVGFLREKYRQEKICVAGHSWGSYLAMRFVAAHPECVKYYIGTGQEVSVIKSEADRYAFVLEQAEKKNGKAALRLLERFGEPEGYHYKKDDTLAKIFVAGSVIRYAGYFSKSGPSTGAYLARYIKLYVKHYGRSTPKLLAGMVRSLLILNAEMDRADSISCITELKVPVLLISGEEDMICPVPTARRWFNELKAPEKNFVTVKNASHMVYYEQPGEWNRLLIGMLDDAENG